MTACLVLSLIHSTGGGEDLEWSETLGRWAGDRIVICSPEQLGDWEMYSNIGDQCVLDLSNEL